MMHVHASRTHTMIRVSDYTQNSDQVHYVDSIPTDADSFIIRSI